MLRRLALGLFARFVIILVDRQPDAARRYEVAFLHLVGLFVQTDGLELQVLQDLDTSMMSLLIIMPDWEVWVS
jgi:hypothetical protein